MSILNEIVEHKRIEVAALKESVLLDELRETALGREEPSPFADSLRSAPMGLIAEVKRRSPSAGIIRDPFQPGRIARAYEAAGAQAISVLMDHKYFGGGEEQFQEVRAAVPLPLLYKEFVIDSWQVWHAASLGASAILLIAAVLSQKEMAVLLECCEKARLEALVEVHDEVDFSKISGLPVKCVGINNRDLKTFTVALETTLRLKNMAPKDSLLVSESGIRSAEDVTRLREGGVDALLVGESLLRQENLEKAITELMSGVWGD